MHNSQIEELIRVNTFSPIVLSKYVVRSMMSERAGCIVNVASIVGFTGYSGLSVYAATKASMLGFTRSLARELGERMIRVNCLLPGLTMGEATKDIPQARWNDYADRAILKRIQQPDDLDGVVAFLLSDDAKFITGQTLAVDGGFSLH